MLLITPYRALEKLIYDLQQAEGINVKMIGQAYEKDDDGNYMLKKGYRKRIGSVVYAEVMAALYTDIIRRATSTLMRRTRRTAVRAGYRTKRKRRGYCATCSPS